MNKTLNQSEGFVMLYSAQSPIVKKDEASFLYLPSIYAHGNLEEMLGFDVLVSSDISVFNKLFNTHYENGVATLSHQVQDNEGKIFDVTILAWQSPLRNLGLVVLNDDSDAMKQALEKQNKKKQFI
jgi:hypothetical protein